MSLLIKKPLAQLLAQAGDSDKGLKRTLGAGNLVALGIGAIIGAGLFVRTAAAAGEAAGPAVVVSFIIAAVGCAFAGLCYAEFASMIPIAGSAYTYTYATMGELVAWIIGWDLILEYAVSNMAVGVGFSAYIKSLFASFGVELSEALTSPAYSPSAGWAPNFNLPGFLVVMFVTVLLLLGIKESAGANTVMVGIKVAAILIFIFAAVEYVNPTNWRPFMPNGWQGVLTGGAIVFFAYIGFDSVSTAAEECRDPKRDMPLGILMTLLVCSILYVSVAVVLTGIQHYSTFMGEAAPVAKALRAVGLDRIQRVVTIGALTGMISSLLVYQYGQTRIWYAMSRDGLLPALFSRVHPRLRVPHISTWVAGIVVGIPAGLLDIGTLADLSSIGTLFAFVLVSIAVLVLRKTQPDRPRGFRVPMANLLAPLSVASCLFLMLGLPVENWLRLAVWLVIGLVIYFAYGRQHSDLNREAGQTG